MPSKPIFILGEAHGEQEAKIGQGFVGPSGIELLRMLNDARIIDLTQVDRNYISLYYQRGDPRAIDSVWRLHDHEVYRSNVFNVHPPGNRLEWFCGNKADGIPSYPALLPSKYVRREFEPELDRLADEILACDPNLILCLGNTSLWALAGRTGVSKLRGTTMVSSHCVSGYKLLPAYHPAAILREWSHRPTTIFDMIKAHREAEFPEIRRPDCEIWTEPTLEDIERYINDYVRPGCDLLSVDIETSGTRVTCLGWATGVDRALVIPFDDERTKGGNYWATKQDEAAAWKLIRSVLIDEKIPKLFHNGLYDITFLWRAYGIGVRGCAEDSMLLSHSLQPESLKGLGYLGSIYTDHGSWKSERKIVGTTIGRDK